MAERSVVVAKWQRMAAGRATVVLEREMVDMMFGVELVRRGGDGGEWWCCWVGVWCMVVGREMDERLEG